MKQKILKSNNPDEQAWIFFFLFSAYEIFLNFYIFFPLRDRKKIEKLEKFF